MNRADTIESRMTTQGMRRVELKPHGSVQPVARRRDPSPVMSILVAIGFVAMAIGVVVFSTYLDHAATNKIREIARTIISR